ncbi:MAG: hypothetical protein ABI375_00370 [Rudaea sp.]
MRVRAWFVASMFCVMCSQGYAASFSCYKASSYVEEAVCSDPGLSRQDDELAALYKEALIKLPDRRAVQWAQRNWLESARDPCHTVQCIKDAYGHRIYGLQRQVTQVTASYPPSPASPVSSNSATPSRAADSPSDEDCANLNAAVETALNSRMPAASLTHFGGRVVAGWRRTDYDAFLTALSSCESRADVAAVLNAFPDESRLLLTTLQQHSTRVEPMEKDVALETVPAGMISRTDQPSPNSATPEKTPSTDAERLTPTTAQGGPSAPVATISSTAASTAVRSDAPVVAPAVQQATTRPVQAPGLARTNTAQSHDATAIGGNFLAGLLLVWILIVIGGIVAGYKGAIVVYRNFDDLAIVFFMGVLFFVGGLAGFYLSGIKNSFAGPLLWGISGLAIMFLFGWTVSRTWRDQKIGSVWRFTLALITKMSLGILFVNNLVTLISPSGKTMGARSRARGSALLFLAVLTPIVLRLVRDHEGVWAPRNLLGTYQRRRMGI